MVDKEAGDRFSDTPESAEADPNRLAGGRINAQGQTPLDRWLVLGMSTKGPNNEHAPNRVSRFEHPSGAEMHESRPVIIGEASLTFPVPTVRGTSGTSQPQPERQRAASRRSRKGSSGSSGGRRGSYCGYRGSR